LNGMRLMRYLRRMPSPSLVISCLALFVAGTGTGVAITNALPKNSVGTPQLRNNAVVASKIANDAIVSSKVMNGSLKALDFATGQLPKGDTGPAGPAGPKGDTGAKGDKGENALTTIVRRGASGAAASVGHFSIAHADCNPGERLIGGGGRANGSARIVNVIWNGPETNPGGERAWNFWVYNNDPAGTTSAQPVAFCASP
jgi:hypothetical protein